MNVFILCWTAVIIIFELASCAIYIDSELGRIKGTHMYSRNRRKFNVFLGIPFAEPPVGELRFQVKEFRITWFMKTFGNGGTIE